MSTVIKQKIPSIDKRIDEIQSNESLDDKISKIEKSVKNICKQLKKVGCSCDVPKSESTKKTESTMKYTYRMKYIKYKQI